MKNEKLHSRSLSGHGEGDPGGASGAGSLPADVSAWLMLMPGGASAPVPGGAA